MDDAHFHIAYILQVEDRTIKLANIRLHKGEEGNLLAPRTTLKASFQGLSTIRHLAT